MSRRTKQKVVVVSIMSLATILGLAILAGLSLAVAVIIFSENGSLARIASLLIGGGLSIIEFLLMGLVIELGQIHFWGRA